MILLLMFVFVFALFGCRHAGELLMNIAVFIIEVIVYIGKFLRAILCLTVVGLVIYVQCGGRNDYYLNQLIERTE